MVDIVRKTLKELKEELKWLEETPFYIGKDGAPSIALILFIILTGFILGIIIIIVYRNFEKRSLREAIKECEKLKEAKGRSNIE
ncbi:hypothetical protein ACFLUF_02575 [Chloroflexota bacterium]